MPSLTGGIPEPPTGPRGFQAGSDVYALVIPAANTRYDHLILVVYTGFGAMMTRLAVSKTTYFVLGFHKLQGDLVMFVPEEPAFGDPRQCVRFR